MRFSAPVQPADRSFSEMYRLLFRTPKVAWPAHFPSPFQDKPSVRFDGLRVTLIGHASFLVQLSGLNILIDPVYSERASPFSFTGPMRVNEPGIAWGDLPPIDVVLITHNHYDHLDRQAVTALHQKFTPRIIAPLGNDTIIRRFDRGIRVEAHGWGDAVDLGNGVRVHLRPSYHWSARGLFDKRMALWCAFVLETRDGVIYHLGDTAYGDGAIFRQVREEFGAPRLAMIPIGAYEPRWFMGDVHVNPEEAVRILLDCRAERAIGYHWGTFQLTAEPIEAPVRALAAALDEAHVPHERFIAFRPGQVFEA